MTERDFSLYSGLDKLLLHGVMIFLKENHDVIND